MRVFNYDKKALSTITVANIIDIVLAVLIDGYFLNEFFMLGASGDLFSGLTDIGTIIITIVILSLIVSLSYCLIRILCGISRIYDLQKEKLVIFEDKIAMTFVKRLADGESLKTIEVPWEKVKKAEKVNLKKSVSFFEISSWFSFNREYKTILIETEEGTYRLFIEYSIDAVEIINKKRNYQPDKIVQPLTSWICHNCEEVNDSNARFCSKCGLAKSTKPTSVKNVESDSSHKCVCGERVYGNSCPNCGREFK